MKLLIYIIFSFAVFLPSAYGAQNGVDAPIAGPGLIVIDPGHGGEDTGAVGPSGILEKDITLSVAKMVAENIRAATDWKVLLTRTEDVFVPLAERTAFANNSGADLFISIHANATVKRDVRGIETYFLSFEATDEDARRLAEFENSMPMLENTAEAGEINEILIDLLKTASHHESSRLAEVVHTSMLKSTGKENRGVKQAPFYVLVGATMPAILVEVGFISNPNEEKWLSSKREQERIAASITKGVLGFRETAAGKKEFIGFNR